MAPVALLMEARRAITQALAREYRKVMRFYVDLADNLL